MKLNERLVKLRRERGLTQRQLADQCGFACATIALYETGDREPNIQNRAKLAEVLGVPLRDLLPPNKPELPPKVVITEPELITFITHYRKLSPPARKAMLTAVRSLAMIQDQQAKTA